MKVTHTGTLICTYGALCKKDSKIRRRRLVGREILDPFRFRGALFFLFFGAGTCRLYARSIRFDRYLTHTKGWPCFYVSHIPDDDDDDIVVVVLIRTAQSFLYWFVSITLFILCLSGWLRWDTELNCLRDYLLLYVRKWPSYRVNRPFSTSIHLSSYLIRLVAQPRNPRARCSCVWIEMKQKHDCGGDVCINVCMTLTVLVCARAGIVDRTVWVVYVV